jgi:hypothetical protein
MNVARMLSGVVLRANELDSGNSAKTFVAKLRGATDAVVTIVGSADGENFTTALATATTFTGGAVTDTTVTPTYIVDKPYPYYKQTVTSISGMPATGAIGIDVVAADRTYTRASGSFLTNGFFAGQKVVASGFTAPNNGTRIIESVTALVMTMAPSSAEVPYTLADETGGGDEVITGSNAADDVVTVHAIL